MPTREQAWFQICREIMILHPSQVLQVSMIELVYRVLPLASLDSFASNSASLN